MPSPSSNRQRQLFLLFLLAMLIAGNALNPCLDVDTWWHLRVGQHIVQEQRLPDDEPFSQLGQQEKVTWIAYSWLYEVLIYETYRVAGFGGIFVLRHLFDLAIFSSIAWVIFRHASSKWLAVGTLALITVSLIPFTPERPWHVTILFTTLTLHAVLNIRNGVNPWRFAWLPAAYALWANIHIQFVLGFALLGLTWLVTLIDWFRTRDESRRTQSTQLFLLGFACTLATLLTPYHVRLYVVIWEYATQTQALRLVEELQRPNLLRWWNWPLDVLLVAAAFAVFLRRFPLLDTVLLASAMFFSLRMQRDLWFGVLIAGTIVVRNFQFQEREQWTLKAWQVVLVSTLAILVMRAAWELGLSNGKTIASCHAKSFPVDAVDYVRKAHVAGPLYNHFNWGGYLIWALPELPVSIDGRTNLYGNERLTQSFNTWRGEEWENDPVLNRANVIVAPKNRKDKEKDCRELNRANVLAAAENHKDEEFPLTELLRESDHWRNAYEDDTAIVFVRVKQP